MTQFNPSHRFDPAQYEASRQGNYEQRMVKVLLKAIAIRSGNKPYAFIRQFSSEDGAELTFLHAGVRLSLPLAITTKRVKPFGVGDLVAHGRKGLKHEVWETVVEQFANYGNDGHIGVIFDCHGDGVPDLIAHNLPGDAFDNIEVIVDPDEHDPEEADVAFVDQWCVIVRRVGQIWHIQPWAAVARRLAALASW